MMIRRGAVGCGTIALLLASSGAVAETKVGAEVGANAGYSSNPFGSFVAGGGDSGSGTASATIAPTVVFVSPTGQISLGGQVTHTEYFTRYDATTDYGVNGNFVQNLSEVTSLSGSAGFSSYVRNALYPVADPFVPPGGPTDPIIVDPAAATSFGQRTETLRGSLQFATSLSARDSITVSARAATLRFTEMFAISSDYDSYGGGVAYRRAIGENSSIGVSMDVGKIKYAEAVYGDSTQYSPAALLRAQLAPRIVLDLSAGVTISEFNRLTGGQTQTSFSGSANLCREGDRSRLCLIATRQVSPSSISGASNVLSISTSYNYSLSERSNVSASVSYSRARSLQNLPGPFPGLTGQNLDYGFASASYNHRLLERLSAVVSVSYSDSFDEIVTRGSNFSGTVGIRYRLGEL